MSAPPVGSLEVLQEAAGSDSAPYGSVLELGSVRILLDCGCDSWFSEAVVERLGRVAASVDLVLLSHHDLRHLGALPILRHRYGLKAPAFATLPCVKLGTLTLYDAWLGLAAAIGRDACSQRAGSLDAVDGAMQGIRMLKYEQPLELRGKGSGIVVTAHRAGYTVGGATWKVECAGTQVVYAVDTRHAAERHAPAVSMSHFDTRERPSVLITDARALDRATTAAAATSTRGGGEDELIAACLSNLRAGGDVVVAVEPTTRLVEVALMLDAAWRDKKLGGAYELLAVHSMARNVVELARCQLEWMTSVDLDLDLPELRVCSTIDEVLASSSSSSPQAQQQQPKCIVASGFPYGACAALVRALDSPSLLVLSVSRAFAGSDPIVSPQEWRMRRGMLAPLEGEALEAHLERGRQDAARREKDEQRRKRAADLAASLSGALRDDHRTGDGEGRAQGQAGDAQQTTEGAPPGGKSGVVVELGQQGSQKKERGSSSGSPDEAHPAAAHKGVFSLDEALSESELRQVHPTLPWRVLHRQDRPGPGPDEYGAPVPEEVLRAIEAAGKSTLLGLETREGFGHLKGDDDDDDEEAGVKRRDDQDDAADAAAAPDADTQQPQRPTGDVAYDDLEEAEPYAWSRDELLVAPRCRRRRVEGLDGLCDARSLKNLIARLRPRSVVVLPSPGATELAAFARTAVGSEAAVSPALKPTDLSAVLGRAPLVPADLTPALQARVSASQRTLNTKGSLAVVRLDDAVLFEQPNGGHHTSHSRRDRPRFLLGEPGDVQDDDEPSSADAADSNKRRAATPAPAAAAAKKRHLWLAAEDVVLPAIKEDLQARGLRADFRQGALVCQGNILVRKSDAGNNRQNIRIEGPLCPDYFTVAAVLKTVLTLV